MLFRWKRKFIFIFLLVVFLDFFFFFGYKIEKLSRWGGSVSSVSFSSLRKPGKKRRKSVNWWVGTKIYLLKIGAFPCQW